MGLMMKASRMLEKTEIGQRYGKLAPLMLAASLGSAGWIYSKWHKRLSDYSNEGFREDWSDIFHGRYPRHARKK